MGCDGTEQFWTAGPGLCFFIGERLLIDFPVAVEFVPGLNEEGFEWFYDFWSKMNITVPDSLRMKGRNDRWDYWC